MRLLVICIFKVAGVRCKVMKLEKIGITLSASLMLASLSGGIAFSATTNTNTTTTANATTNTATGSVSADAPPELQSAQQRVELSKARLEQAKQQLSAAKAMLKAADAEFKAARADQEALSLRTQARKLADASGLQDTVSTGTRLYPATVMPLGAPSPGAAFSPVGAGAVAVPAAQSENVDVAGQTAPPAAALGAPTP